MSLDEIIFPASSEVDPLRAAVFLAMSSSLEEEHKIIEILRSRGCLCVATMVTGSDAKALREVNNNVLGACLNAGVIERKHEHAHPLTHAVNEAVLGTRLDSSTSQNCRLKVGVVRIGNKIAVAMFGNLGFHELTSHTTIGAGYQILGE